jgi:LPS-assembly lipoprotein
MMKARIASVVAAGLLAGACGFHPLYGDQAEGSRVAGDFSTVYVDPISDFGVANTGYELRNALIDQLDSNRGATYHLRVTFSETNQGIVLLQNASITRYNDKISVKYTLSDSTGKVLIGGTETGLSDYNAVASPYATLVAQQDADKRSAQDIAERIRIKLAVYFEQRQQ